MEQMHGYQIIKQLEEKAEGLYSPSAGTIYPALQELHDKGMIDTEEQKDKRVYFLNEAGMKYIHEMELEPEQFWVEWRSRLAWKQSEACKRLREELDLWEQQIHSAKGHLVKNPALTEDLLGILADSRKQVARWAETYMKDEKKDEPADSQPNSQQC
jgi:DNA-binding PadR family transcriptional regulator